MKRFIIVFLFLSFNVFSQDIKTTEMQVVEEFNPYIPEAKRLNEYAVFLDTIKNDRKQTYQLIDADLASAYQITPLKAALVRTENKNNLYNTYTLLATGYRSNALFSISYNKKINNQFSYGGLIYHNNYNAKVDKKKAAMNNNLLYFYSKKVWSTNIINTYLKHERNSAYTYGHDYTQDFDQTKTYFAYTKLAVNMMSQQTSKYGLRHNTSLFLTDLNYMSENQFHFNSSIDKKINNYPFIFNITFDNYANYNSEEAVYLPLNKSIQLFSFTPSFSKQRFGIDFDFSLGLDYASDASFDLFPSVIASKELVENILIVTLGVEDDKYRNTYKSLSDENRYIHTLGTNQRVIVSDTLLDLRTTESKHFFFKIKNSLGYNDIWDASFTYGFVENLHYFDNNYQSSYNRFLVYYVDVWQLAISSSYERKLNNMINLNVNMDYYDWGEQELAHKPNLLLSTYMSINLRNKILLKPQFQYFGKQNAFNQVFYQMNSRSYFNLNIEYRYSKKISAFLFMNNIFNSKQEIWRDYNHIGFNALFGFNYQF